MRAGEASPYFDKVAGFPYNYPIKSGEKHCCAVAVLTV